MTQPKNKGGRPATGYDPVRSIRMPANLWAAVKDTAARDGKTITQVLNDFAKWYTSAPGARMPKRPPAPDEQG